MRIEANKLTEEFRKDWQTVTENLEHAIKAFDNLEGIRSDQRVASKIGVVAVYIDHF
jgi:hypothetical protein